MSHEIRTPINGIIGMTELALDTDLDPVQREYLEIVISSADSLLAVINDILDFSKIEAGKLDMEPLPFDLLRLIEESTEMLAGKARENDNELLVRYPPDCPRDFIADAGRLRQVLVNLVDNAIKFTQNGCVLVDVTCEQQSEGKAQVRVAVEDSGIGIPTDRQTDLFKEFSQADVSTTREFGGTGLGLAISRRIVELMGGTMGVESSPGKGSTFWFLLELPVGPSPREREGPRADLAGLRALVVDNDPTARRIATEQLIYAGVSCESAASASAALDALHAAHAAGSPYHIAILDHQMPNVDGESLGRQIKSDPALLNTVLVMLNSIADKGESRRFAQQGFAAYLVKPVRQALLIDTLASVWSGHEAAKSRFITRDSIVMDRAASDRPAVAEKLTIDANILVAEDNIVNQKVARRFLENLGCRVQVVANGQEAVEMVDTRPFDLVLMDCQMPEMDGYQATLEIRRREHGASHIPIVAMTADAMGGDSRALLGGRYGRLPGQTGQVREAGRHARTLDSANVIVTPDC